MSNGGVTDGGRTGLVQASSEDETSDGDLNRDAVGGLFSAPSMYVPVNTWELKRPGFSPVCVPSLPCFVHVSKYA